VEIKTLHKNKWLSLKEMKDEKNGVGGYVFAHEESSKGKKVAILPYRITENSDYAELLLRSEVTPCWSMDPLTSSVTGSVEEDDIEGTMVMEVKEEAGFDITKEDLISLGTCYGSKAMDTVYHLFSVDLTGKEQGEATGDGSELEAKAHCFWSESVEAVDPLVYVMAFRLMNYLEEN